MVRCVAEHEITGATVCSVTCGASDGICGVWEVSLMDDIYPFWAFCKPGEAWPFVFTAPRAGQAGWRAGWALQPRGSAG